MYRLDKEVRSFAIANDFVVTSNKACYALGVNLQPFCIFADKEQLEHGVIDFAAFTGFVDNSKTLVQEIAEMRSESYNNIGIRISPDHDRLLFYDYLLSTAMCYVEIPKWVTKMGVATATYDKFLCTRNPAIMAAWMGMPQPVMQAKYSSKIAVNEAYFINDEIRFVKLISKAEGNTITVPRGSFSALKMRCIPVYMLNAFMAGVKTHLDKEIVQFEYLKDNGTIRELASTLNTDILMDYYNDNNQVSQMLAGVDIATVNQGGMYLPSKISRGYAKIPELGASRYDSSGCRSLNLARILTAQVVDAVDRSYIDVDLDSVLGSFCSSIDYLVTHKLADIKEVYEEFVKKPSEVESDIAVAANLKEWASSMVVYLSTQFQRELHKMIIGHPLWFPYYTGKPLDTSSLSQPDNADFEDAAPMDF